MNAANIAAGAHGLIIAWSHLYKTAHHMDYEYDAQHPHFLVQGSTSSFDEQHLSTISRILESRYVLMEAVENRECVLKEKDMLQQEPFSHCS